MYVKEVSVENAKLTQYRYAHRRYKNLLVNEIKVELLKNTDVIVQVFNRTNLVFDFMSSNNIILNPAKYSYYVQDPNAENLLFEQQVIRHPTRISQHSYLNDGI